jgi:HEAT repeat protein
MDDILDNIIYWFHNLFVPNIPRLQHAGKTKRIVSVLQCRYSEAVRYVKDDSGVWLKKDVRKHAARALGEMADPKAFDPLLSCVEDPQEWGDIREEAALALASLGDARSIAPLLKWVDSLTSITVWFGYELVPETLIDKFSSMGQEGANVLLSVLPHYAGLAREIIDKSLGRMHDLGFLDEETSTLLSTQFSLFGPIEEEDIRLVGNLRDRRAIGKVARILKTGSSGERAAAAEALGKIGDKKAIGLLEEALSDEFNEIWEIRDAIEKALKILRNK